MIDFAGGRVVITGAGGGVGTALVDVFSKLGAAVVACDMPGADLPMDRIAEAHHFDLLDEKALESACDQIIVDGPPAAVISNAGLTRAETLADVDDEALRAELDLNFRSAARLSKGADPGDARQTRQGRLRVRLVGQCHDPFRQSRLRRRQGRPPCLDARDRDRGRQARHPRERRGAGLDHDTRLGASHRPEPGHHRYGQPPLSARPSGRTGRGCQRRRLSRLAAGIGYHRGRPSGGRRHRRR